MSTYYNHETHNVESSGDTVDKNEFITWHALTTTPELIENDISETQVTGVWSATLRPVGTDDYFTDGPFVAIDSYLELIADDSGTDPEYGITTQLEFGIRENGNVTESWYTYEYGVLAVFDVARGFEQCKIIVSDYIEQANEYFFWDGKTEVQD